MKKKTWRIMEIVIVRMRMRRWRGMRRILQMFTEVHMLIVD